MLDDLFIDLDDLAKLRFSLAVDGYTAERHRALAASDPNAGDLPAALVAKFGDMALSSASLRYDDWSLFSRVIETIAARDGTDPQMMASGLGLIVSIALAEAADHDGFAAMAHEAIGAFVADPWNLVIALEPDRPVTLAGFATFADQVEVRDIIDRLGIRITANQ